MSTVDFKDVKAGGNIHVSIQTEANADNRESVRYKWIYLGVALLLVGVLIYVVSSPDITQNVGSHGVGVVNQGSGNVNISVPDKAKDGK